MGGSRQGPLWRLAGAMTATSLALWSPSPALAEEPRRVVLAQLASTPVRFAIPPQPLASALTQFGEQAGVSVLVPAERVAGVASPGVSGELAPETALDRLLAGTGLIARTTERGTVTVEAIAGGADGALALGPVTVEAQAAAPPTAVLDNLPPPFAGGQVARGGQLGVLGVRDIFDTPFSTKNFTSELIEDRQATGLTDVLDFDPSVLPTGRGSTFEDANIRGFLISTANEALLNGLRLPPQQGVVAEFYERIDLLKGPSALLDLSTGNVGGLINLVPKIAMDDPVTSGTLSIASDIQYRGHADLGRRLGPSGELGVRFNAVGNTGDSWRQYGEDQLAAGALALDYRGERFRLLGYGDLVDGEFGDRSAFIGRFAGPGRAPPPDPRRFASFNWEEYNAFTKRGLLAAEYDVLDDVTFYAKFGGARSDENNSTFGVCEFDRAGNCEITPFANDYNYRFLAGEVGLRAAFDLGPVRNQASAGYSANKTWIDDRSFEFFAPFDVDGFDPPKTPDPTRGEPTDSFPKATFETLLSGPVFANTFSILEERVQLTLGARVQNIDDRSESEGVRTNNYDQWETSPAVGLVIKPGLGLSFYGSYIEALEQGATAPQEAVNRGQALPPAVAKQTEIGVKWDGGNVGVTAALFEITRPSAILDADDVFREDGEQRSRGLELETFGEPLPGVRLLGGLALLDAELRSTEGGINDGNQVPGAPDYVVKMSAEWDLPFLEGLTVNGLVIRVGEQKGNNANTVTLAPWTRVDLGLRYQLGEHVTLRGRVENLFDEEYWETAEAFDGNYAIGAPRTFVISGTVSF